MYERYASPHHFLTEYICLCGTTDATSTLRDISRPIVKSAHRNGLNIKYVLR